jgi:dihydrofolate synthase/folylpolyglutamate synthase
MKYQETVDYLFTRLPMYSRIGAAAYKADLDNTIELCRSLGDPHTKFRSVHIAGTNGKGSVSHLLASILQEAGYKTGLYTSPHLWDFRERIKINGIKIPEEYVITFTEGIQSQIERIEPSFFEITVAMAFNWFASEEVDIALIETGLGGRLDSTNIIIPELSVITNIGMDHMDLLGDTIDKIAGEKAGIIKDHVPVVIGEKDDRTREVFEDRAWEKNAPLVFADDRRKALNWYWLKNELIVEIAKEQETDHRIYRLDLPGIYQVKNLVTVLESVDQLKQAGWEIPESAILEGIRNAKKSTGLHGRWEIIHQSPLIVLDVAHNAEGIKQLREQVEVTDHHDLHIVLGFVKDKKIEDALALLPKHAHYYFTQAQIPRALPAAELKGKAISYELNGGDYPDVNDALRAARDKAKPQDLIIVCGSIFVVAEARI